MSGDKSQGQTQEVPVVTKASASQSQNNPKRQATTAKLPSRGLLYNGQLGESVDVYPMTTNEEALIAGGGGKAETRINKLLQNCVGLAKFDHEELLSIDRQYLLIMIRILSYGPEYKYEMNCVNPQCGVKYVGTCNLAKDFDIKFAEDDLAEPIEVTLPISKKKVGFRFLRGHDEVAISKYGEKMVKNTKFKVIGDPEYKYRLCRLIQTIDGEEQSNLAITEFVDNMVAGDSLALRRAVEANMFGFQAEMEVECSKCGHEHTTNLPLSAEFFRPTV